MTTTLSYDVAFKMGQRSWSGQITQQHHTLQPYTAIVELLYVVVNSAFVVEPLNFLTATLAHEIPYAVCVQLSANSELSAWRFSLALS